MKITLDLTDLVAKGQLTPDEARRLQGLAAQDTGALGVNILMAFGAVAISLGVGAFFPSVYTAIVLGGLMFAVGFALTLNGEGRWNIFAQVAMVIGALAFTGGLSVFSNGSFVVNLGLSALLAVAAVVARSGLLAALSVLGLTAALVTMSTDWGSPFGASIVVTIVALAALTLVLYLVSRRVGPAYERVALIGARTAILMINFAFLTGSLFGDSLITIPAVYFSVGWALALVAFGLWAIVANRRWVVNIVAVFGAIHFFVQWFWFLGASPVSILGGGLLLIAFGFALRAFNQRFLPKAAAPTAAA